MMVKEMILKRRKVFIVNRVFCLKISMKIMEFMEYRIRLDRMTLFEV